MLDARQAQRHRTEAGGGVATQGAARSRHVSASCSFLVRMVASAVATTEPPALLARRSPIPGGRATKRSRAACRSPRRPRCGLIVYADRHGRGPGGRRVIGLDREGAVQMW
jgi:hypothetical protein